MTSVSISAIDALFSDAEAAATAGKWDTVRRCARAALELEPGNARAKALVSRAAAQAPDSAAPARGPLHGIRVLEFSLIFSAPFGGIHLSDLGAEVIKVEQPGGEPFRSGNTLVKGHSKTFQAMNRGKRSLVVDLHSPEGLDVIRRLIPSVDVVLLNYRPGVAERLGIGYKALSALKPDLIYAEICGFSPNGPMAGRAASDMVAQAYGGAVALDGKLDDDGAPVWPSIAIGDLPAGMASALGIVSALYHRERTGEGQYLSVSLLRTVMSLMNYIVMVEPVNDAASRDLIKERLEEVRAGGGSYKDLIEARENMGQKGSSHGVYWSGYQASDGGIVVGALTRANRDAIRAVLGVDDDPTDDPEYDPTDPANHVIVEQLKQRIRARMRQRTVAEWIDLFEKAGAPAAPVRLPEDIADDPEGALHMVELVHEVTGAQRVVRPLVEFARSPSAVASAAPMVGQHTDAILSELAGYARDEVDALLARWDLD